MLAHARIKTLALGVAASVVAFGAAKGQATAAAAISGPGVNDVAPDFTLSGATRYGLLKNRRAISAGFCFWTSAA